MNEKAPDVQMIPIEQINVLNPRSRNKLVFQGIVSNISNIGLKRPITVALRSQPIDGKVYDLVCGEGRLNAYVSLGYTTTEIAKKIDLAKSYVAGICHLLENGEERLLAAVEKGRVPVSVAMLISDSDEAGIQQALCDAYEDKTLRGRKLLAVRRLIEQRKTNGKRRKASAHKQKDGLPSAESLASVYRQEADRQKLLVKKARLTENHLIFVVSALKKLFQDENFLTLLRAEGLDTLPEYLGQRIHVSEKG
jgi:ParB family chromosome partitioning protein